jgi:hypothetical protein
MTKLAPSRARSPMRPLTEEEASTYRKWAKGWYVVLLIALAIIVTADLVLQDRKDEAIRVEAIP